MLAPDCGWNQLESLFHSETGGKDTKTSSTNAAGWKSGVPLRSSGAQTQRLSEQRNLNRVGRDDNSVYSTGLSKASNRIKTKKKPFKVARMEMSVQERLLIAHSWEQRCYRLV